ncbi:MAG: GNAT family N-acetyltransferase [Gemmatimonadota bacterium]|nr:MAG: GNAT family N-acetyltransferase [Gemmatimonadota bacterium]
MTTFPDLRQLASHSQHELAGLLAEVFGAAAAAFGGNARLLERHRAIVAAVSESPHVNAVLEAVDLADLADLLDRCVGQLRESSAGLSCESLRTFMWDVLDMARRPAVLRRVPAESVTEWSDRFLAAVEASHFTVGPLFRHRAATYGQKVLFEVPPDAGGRSLTWRHAAVRVDRLARAFLSLGGPQHNVPIAILSENRPEMALVDLACLTSGQLNVVVPGNSTEADVGYILRHSRAGVVVVSNSEQLRKVEKNRESLPDLKWVVTFDRAGHRGDGHMTLEELEARAVRVPSSAVRARSLRVEIDDAATVMYTSGTTGSPKGIQYSHRNLVFKRFARALALPEIGDEDIFLAYLPLFHTFGRYLEMLGCVFWGAKYCFLLNPSVDALTGGMRRYRPTVFISVPRKWIQLYEAIAQRADPLHASDEEVLEATRSLTGGRLKWGLSAAGYLDPDIFKFFHRQGVQLLSGFGMSEATGGITMTLPGQYKENSLGVALPGIELELADDGELLLRGPYVMIGYLDPPDGEPSFDEHGWLHSGDLMRMDDDGHIQLVDRKKEIYKNVKGQTIAPQRIENLFREFESVARVFLVGDHRAYNTLLIYPNPDSAQLDLDTLSRKELHEHFRSLVASVNKFVAPYERIVDFAIIDHDLDAEQGELTPKGTPRRKVVVEHFAETIESLYRRVQLHVGGIDIAIPNWLFQSLSVTTHDMHATESEIVLPSLDARLSLQRHSETEVVVGSCIYRWTKKVLDFGELLATPHLWLGNEELAAFAQPESVARQTPGRADADIEWVGRLRPYRPTKSDHDKLAESLRHSEWDLTDLHTAARMLSAKDEKAAMNAVRLLERVLANEEGPLAEPARHLLGRGVDVRSPDVRRRVFQMLVPAERVTRFRDMLTRFFAADPRILDEETSAFLCERDLDAAKIGTLIEYASAACAAASGKGDKDRLAQSLLRFLAEYGAAHPVQYRRTRAFLVQMSLFAPTAQLRAHAADARATLEAGFHQWLGPAAKIAVDTETGQEYRWEDVVVFDEGVHEDDQRRMLSAIRSTAFLREAVFLFYRGTVIRLNDIPPGGVWIRKLGERHGKAVYRVTVQTRNQDSFDVAVNVNRSLASDQVHEEVDWLILCGAAGGRDSVVEDFGGYLPEQDLWSEEYVSGDTLDRELRRLARRSDVEEGLVSLWPFLAWSALSAYVEFWQRTGKRFEIADLSTTDIVLPTHDYHRGSRLVSLSARQPYRGLLPMLRSFREQFVEPVERQYEELAGAVGWDVIFSSLLEVLGEQDGLAACEEALQRENGAPEELRRALKDYVGAVRRRGFLPKRLFFAAKRYRRWARLNEDATPQARARTLQELYDTYRLDGLADSHPEVRLRFFRETVFREAPPELERGLDELISQVRIGEMKNGELADAVADLRRRLKLGPDEDYFLARIPFAYLRPEDTADFVTSDMGGSYQTEIVMTLEDLDGTTFRVRHAMMPKEVERLHRLFLAAKLDVRFRPEHKYLLAINDREQIIGGIFYEFEASGETAHLEKIVVAQRFRRKGVAEGLMREFFNRLGAAGVKRVTTGFFRPEYFYAHGFKIEKRYAGLVKSLDGEPAAPAEG